MFLYGLTNGSGVDGNVDFTRLDTGTVIGDLWTVGRVLGVGGLGAVYEVSGADGQPAAIKLLVTQGQMDAEAHARFEREVTISASLNHPHIVPLLDAGVDPSLGLPFMVMPVMEGFDLLRLLREHGVLHPTIAVRIACQVCTALEAAHDAGFVHRDIKPGNIFLDHDDRGGITVRVLDFGVAKWLASDGQLTRTGMLIGTPFYMAPEQVADSKTVDHRCDVWSVAVVLYRALGGRAPFNAPNVSELYAAIAGADPPMLQERAAWIDPSLAQIVHGALIKDLDARCPSAADFRRALEPFAGGTDELTAAMFRSLSAELRNATPPLASRPTRWTVVAPSEPVPPIAPAVRDPWIGKVLADRYRLVRCLGSGGMATVFEAVTTERERLAVKVVDPRFAGRTPDAQRRFVREAQAMASIDSEHVVRVVEAGTDEHEQVPYIVMELLRGSDLQQLVRRRGPLEPMICARLFAQACRGLAAVHRRGLVHRDIKPSNLFLHDASPTETVLKVFDFGVVKRFLLEDDDADTTQLTNTGSLIGSPAYMSPEQARNERPVDQRTDIWSLGAALHFALTGRTLWDGCDTVPRLMLAICSKDVPSVQDEAPWVSPELAGVVQKALRRDSAARYQSMDELEQALLGSCGDTVQVRRTQLAGVPDHRRQEVQPRLEVPTPEPSQDDTLVGAGPHESIQPPKRRAWSWRAGALVAVLGTGAILVLWTAYPGATQPVERDAEITPLARTSTSRAADGDPLSIAVPISPPSASVTVDGEEQPLREGRLLLRGGPGHSFDVVVTDGTRRLETRLIVTKDGKPWPSELTLSDAPSAPTDASHAGPASAKTTRPQKPAAPTTSAAPVAPPDPPPTPTIARPVRETWE